MGNWPAFLSCPGQSVQLVFWNTVLGLASLEIENIFLIAILSYREVLDTTVCVQFIINTHAKYLQFMSLFIMVTD